MTQDRRTFLKTSALASAAVATGVPFTTTAPLAQKAAVGNQVMPRGFVFATLRRGERLRPRRAHRAAACSTSSRPSRT